MKWCNLPLKNTFRSIDGENNNLKNPEWGATYTQILRLTTPVYADGIYEPRGGFNSILPSAREISNAIADQSESIINSTERTDDDTGKLLTTIGENGEILLPFRSDNTFFMAGDIRVNEQIGLTSIHTL